MALKPELQLKTGTGKNGKDWYMLITVAGKYTGEPVFISELEYEYLRSSVNVAEQRGGSLLDEDEDK